MARFRIDCVLKCSILEATMFWYIIYVCHNVIKLTLQYSCSLKRSQVFWIMGICMKVLSVWLTFGSHVQPVYLQWTSSIWTLLKRNTCLIRTTFKSPGIITLIQLATVKVKFLLILWLIFWWSPGVHIQLYEVRCWVTDRHTWQLPGRAHKCTSVVHESYWHLMGVFDQELAVTFAAHARRGLCNCHISFQAHQHQTTSVIQCGAKELWCLQGEWQKQLSVLIKHASFHKKKS